MKTSTIGIIYTLFAVTRRSRWGTTMAEGGKKIEGVMLCLEDQTNKQPTATNPVRVLDESGEGDGTAIECPADLCNLQRPGNDTEALASLRAEHAKTLEELGAAKEQLKQYRDQMTATENTIRCDYKRSLK